MGWRLSLFAGLLAASPFIFQLVTRHPYPVPTSGGVVITGASTGIGKHGAVSLAREGFTVFAGVRKQSDGEALKKLSAGIVPVILDVTQEEHFRSAKAVIDKELAKRALPLVGIIVNAGVATYPQPGEFLDIEEMKWLHDVNVYGAIRTVKTFLQDLRSNKGRIVLISSVAGIASMPLMTPYCSSKWALEAFSNSLRVEMLKHDVSVSVIEPAYVQSDIFEKSRNVKMEEMKERSKELYGHLWMNDAYIERCIGKASPASVTSDAMLDALRSPYPYTRKVVANVDGTPANILAIFLKYLPDRLHDMLVYRMIGKGQKNL